ncbi:hypothetical protein [Curtobacterium sp. L1-20]|uniref:hypothetical protein n=1 Tax=Curtobacterium sp. L1-20 TaxID=3138181 RepID=UPI003B52A7BF
MRNTTTNQIIVLVCAVVSIVLGVVGPVLSSGTVATWIPFGIGVLLFGQWALMRRSGARDTDRAAR